MQDKNKITISLGERILETVILINDQPIFGIIDVKLHINANDVMPTMHIIMHSPNNDMSEDLKKSLENNFNLLKSIPYIEVTLQELK